MGRGEASPFLRGEMDRRIGRSDFNAQRGEDGSYLERSTNLTGLPGDKGLLDATAAVTILAEQDHVLARRQVRVSISAVVSDCSQQVAIGDNLRTRDSARDA